MYLWKVLILAVCLNLKESGGKFTWKLHSDVTDEDLARRPDGAWVSKNGGRQYQVYIGVVNLFGYNTIANFRPASPGYGSFYQRLLGGVQQAFIHMWENDANPMSVVVSDMPRWSWVYHEGRLPNAYGTFNLNKFEDGNLIIPCRAFARPNMANEDSRRTLALGLYLIQNVNGSGYASDGCTTVMGHIMTVHREYEYMTVNLIGTHQP